MISQNGDKMENKQIKIGDQILYSMDRQSLPTISGKVTNMRNFDVYINGEENRYTGFIRRIDEVKLNTMF